MLQTRHLRPGFVKVVPDTAVGAFCLSHCTQCCWRILPVPLHSVLLEDSAYSAYPSALSAVGRFCLSLCTCFPHGNQLNFAQHYQIWNKALSACAKSTNRGILALTKHHTNATTKTQLSTVTHAWHASKYKVHKLCQRYIF